MARRASQDASLKKQFELQSQNFAAVLTDLQVITRELDEQRASTQRNIDEATAASLSRAEEMEQRAAALEERALDAEKQLAAKEDQRVTEVSELGEVLTQLQEQWEVKKQKFAILTAELQRRSGSGSLPNGSGAGGR